MNPTVTNPTLAAELAKLKDVHELAPISWWPPAMGWWLLAGSLLLLTMMLVIKLYPRWQLRGYRRFFLQQLNHVKKKNDALQMQRLNLLIKKMALLAFPREQVAGLTGSAWTTFLREQGPKNRTLHALQTALGEQQFRSSAALTTDADTVHNSTDTIPINTSPSPINTTAANTSVIYTPELWRDAEAWLEYVLTTQRHFILQFHQQNRRKIIC
jgi:hypothetical protein